MALMKQLSEIFKAKELSAVDSYWSLLKSGNYDPEEMHAAAVRIGKDVEAVERDAELLADLRNSPMPDMNAITKVSKTAYQQAEKARLQALELKAKASKKLSESEILRNKARHDRQLAEDQAKHHRQVKRALAAAGCPECLAEVEAEQASKRAEHERKLSERARSDLEKQLNALRSRLEAAHEKDGKGVELIQNAIEKAESELQGFTSVGRA